MTHNRVHRSGVRQLLGNGDANFSVPVGEQHFRGASSADDIVSVSSCNQMFDCCVIVEERNVVVPLGQWTIDVVMNRGILPNPRFSGVRTSHLELRCERCATSPSNHYRPARFQRPASREREVTEGRRA